MGKISLPENEFEQEPVDLLDQGEEALKCQVRESERGSQEHCVAQGTVRAIWASGHTFDGKQLAFLVSFLLMCLVTAM